MFKRDKERNPTTNVVKDIVGAIVKLYTVLQSYEHFQWNNRKGGSDITVYCTPFYF